MASTEVTVTVRMERLDEMLEMLALLRADATRRAESAKRPSFALPFIGEAYGGGRYAGITLHEGAPHRLVFLPGEAQDLQEPEGRVRRGLVLERRDI